MKKINIYQAPPGKNSLRVPLVIYADIECLLMKIDSCENTSINSYTERKALHVPCDILYLLVTPMIKLKIGKYVKEDKIVWNILQRS